MSVSRLCVRESLIITETDSSHSELTFSTLTVVTDVSYPANCSHLSINVDLKFVPCRRTSPRTTATTIIRSRTATTLKTRQRLPRLFSGERHSPRSINQISALQAVEIKTGVRCQAAVLLTLRRRSRSDVYLWRGALSARAHVHSWLVSTKSAGVLSETGAARVRSQ